MTQETTTAAAETKKLTRVRVRAKHDLSAFTNPDAVRFALGDVKYDSARNEFVATDARVLAIAKGDPPGDGEELDVPDLRIPGETLRRIRRGERGDWPLGDVHASNDETGVEVDHVVLEFGSTAISAPQSVGRFPAYEKILEARATEKTVARIRVDARLLRNVAAHALRSSDGPADLVFEIPTKDDAPISIEALEADGCDTPLGLTFFVMPIVDPADVEAETERREAATR